MGVPHQDATLVVHDAMISKAVEQGDVPTRGRNPLAPMALNIQHPSSPKIMKSCKRFYRLRDKFSCQEVGRSCLTSGGGEYRSSTNGFQLVAHQNPHGMGIGLCGVKGL